MALVFLDLDGTVLDRGKPAAGVIETIELLKQNGHKPMIATGRVPQLLYGVEKVLGIPDYIAANGNYILYDGKVIYERYIPKPVVQRLIDTCDNLEVDLVLEGVKGYVAMSKRSPLVDQFSEVFDIEFPKIDREYPIHNEVLACVFFDDTKIEEIRSLFPELVFNRSNRFGYDVNLKGELKADGIRWLINHFSLPQDEIFAIGDGLNDITMLLAVKNGIAMGNSTPQLKAVAKYITDDVDKQGVRKALEHFGLINSN